MPFVFVPTQYWRLLHTIAVALLLVAAAHAADSPGRRIALVIGNGNYQQPDLPKLSNPVHDAEDMARALRGFGFEVIERKNQTLEGMNRAIAEFGSRIGGSEAALFYYAGHGIQVRNQNYLIPVNATIESEAAVPYQGINVNQVLDEMDNGKSGVNIVMLDACRNNPITGKFRSARTRGLASPGSSPKGTVIVYATDPGNIASDGSGRNGLFTAGLLTAFKGRDLSLDGVLTVASAEVERASNQAQTPYINGPKTLQKSFRFRVTAESGPAEQPPVAVAVAATPPSVFDGHWAVSVVCEDVQKYGRVAKGYTYNFFADIRDGALKAEAGQAGQPGSLTMVGTVQSDGTAELHATGLTASPEMAFGMRSGMPYSYSMRGTFTQALGKMKRIELRPCEATFIRTE
jgi:hypothetical protein